MLERERKFLLEDLSAINGISPEVIQQGYLMLGGDKQLRIRITEAVPGFKQAHICYKAHVSDTDRDEFEYEIPLEDGLALYESCKFKLKKLRYYIHIAKNLQESTILVDEYMHGLRVVEIEFCEDLTTIPDFCGQEITGVKVHSNINIAKNGWSLDG